MGEETPPQGCLYAQTYRGSDKNPRERSAPAEDIGSGRDKCCTGSLIVEWPRRRATKKQACLAERAKLSEDVRGRRL